MKKIIYAAAAAIILAGCASNSVQEQKVMARAVPERADDFVWENNLVCYRAYGEALEGETLSPGFDIWVKLPGALVADQRYKDELENGKTYHKDWGNGKDCYKVGKTLGGGASAVVIDGQLVKPATNYRSAEILSQSADEVVFVLHYPEWSCGEGTIALDKKITVIADSYFCKVEDTYTFSSELGESLQVAAGFVRHDIETEEACEDRAAIWEHASDTSVEPEDGMIGIAVYMPEAECCGLIEDDSHSACIKSVKSGETLTYYFGSCWSKGDIKTSEDWFAAVKAVNAF